MIKKAVGLCVFLIGLLILLIPQWMIFYNDWEQSQQIADYEIRLLTDDFSEKTQEINAYNESLINGYIQFEDPFKNYSYAKTSSGVSLFEKDEAIGYIKIPKIGENLPIYVGASNYHLSKGIAVIEGTSLPYGGVDTHSVLAGHRGYGYANLFRNLDDLVAGDVFYIHIFGETLMYTIYEKEIILPTQTEKLAIIPDRDVVTLLTCHPHLSNTHRLLVKGERTDLIMGSQDSDDRDGGMIANQIQKDSHGLLNEAFIRYRLTNRLVVILGTILVILNIGAIIRVFFKKQKK